MEKVLRIITVLSIYFYAQFALADDAVSPIRIPLHASEVSLDPTSEQDISSLLISRQINCQLVREESGSITLDAASSIQFITPLKILITLNQNAKFYDGTQVTSQDVISSFNYLKNSRKVLRNIFNWVKVIQPEGKNQILFILKKPIPQFLTVLSAPNYAIFKKEFIAKAEKNSNLWKMPMGCGNYHIVKSDSTSLLLLPIHKGKPLKFYLLPKSQISADQIDQFDIIAMKVVGTSPKLNNYNTIEIFDPFQFYLALNSKKYPWNNEQYRCLFLSKINPTQLISSYDNRVKPSNDYIPEGTLGYDPTSIFTYKNPTINPNISLPKIKSFCFAYLMSSVEMEYRSSYENMIKSIYPHINILPMTSSRNFGSNFVQSNCDAMVYALKSNYNDGYEFLLTFSEPQVNPTGYFDKSLSNQIENSQLIDDPIQRAKYYRNIINDIHNKCLIYPLFTMPTELIYIKKGLNVPGIGKEALNDYYLGNVS